MTAAPREKEIEERARRWAQSQGWYCRKWSSPSVAGVPDRIFIQAGVVVFIEMKRPGGRLTARQEREIRELQRHGAVAEVAYSVDDVKAILGRYENAR